MFHLPSFQVDHKMPPEVKRGESQRRSSEPLLAGTALVEHAAQKEERHSSISQKGRQPVQHLRINRKRIPGERRTHSGSYLEQMIDRLDASKGVKGLILDSWRPKTRAQYEVYLRQWKTYCLVHGVDHKNPPLRKIHNFLLARFKSGVTFSAVNSARCALSAFYLDKSPVTVGAHWMTSKVMMGIRNRPPPKSRYQSTWDVDVVLELLKTWTPVKKVSLKILSLKLAMLMLLTSCQHVQTLASLKTEDLFWSPDGRSATFRLTEMLKHSRRGTLGLVHFTEFIASRDLCVITVLKEYLLRTREFRRGTADPLFISHRKPHDRIKKEALSGWIRTVLAMAGIDTSAFKAHSVRGASASKLAEINIPVAKIMEKASWSCESTFQKFYNKNIVPHKDVAHDMLQKFINEQN